MNIQKLRSADRMKSPTRTVALAFWLLGCACLLGSGAALAAAGTVEFVSGEVGVQRGSVTLSPVVADPVESGDAFVTGATGRLRVRMSNGERITLRPNSHFVIDTFVPPASPDAPETGRSFYSLLKGRFDTVTGSSGQRNQDSYRVVTPVAVIGIRGTTLTGALSNGLYVKVDEGTAVVSNSAGPMLVKTGEIGFTASSTAPTVLVRELPAGIDEDSDLDSAGGAGLTGAAADGNGPGASGGDGGSGLTAGSADTDAGTGSDIVWGVGIFTAMVFLAVFALVMAMSSSGRSEPEQRLRTRLQDVSRHGEIADVSLLREKYLRELSPLERNLESLPGMATVERLIAQSGRRMPAYQLLALCLILGLLAGALTTAWTHAVLLGLLAALMVSPTPLLMILNERSKRWQRFEEQLPDALDIISRALRAGNPFNDALHTVAEEMSDPCAAEFGLTWSHLNYGLSLKDSFADLVERMPSMSLRVLATAVLVQRETGGNLAEVVDKLSKVLRARFRFDRRVRTLTAEGRMSAWVLILMPFVLAGMLSVVSPTYLPMLTKDPTGQKLIVGALVAMAIGAIWIRRIIKIRI